MLKLFTPYFDCRPLEFKKAQPFTLHLHLPTDFHNIMRLESSEMLTESILNTQRKESDLLRSHQRSDQIAPKVGKLFRVAKTVGSIPKET